MYLLSTVFHDILGGSAEVLGPSRGIMCDADWYKKGEHCSPYKTDFY